jgi:death-on-curing family protein
MIESSPRPAAPAVSATSGRSKLRSLNPERRSTVRNCIQILWRKAAALCFGLVCGHAFVDGNKRIGHAAMEMLLLLNGHQLVADVDDQEKIILGLAAGTIHRDELPKWVRDHVCRLDREPG